MTLITSCCLSSKSITCPPFLNFLRSIRSCVQVHPAPGADSSRLSRERYHQAYINHLFAPRHKSKSQSRCQPPAHPIPTNYGYTSLSASSTRTTAPQTRPREFPAPSISIILPRRADFAPTITRDTMGMRPYITTIRKQSAVMAILVPVVSLQRLPLMTTSGRSGLRPGEMHRSRCPISMGALGI